MLLSGGVDSSVALALLKEQMPEARLTAYYLKIWLEDELSFLGSCPWEEDLEYARSVCDMLGVSLKVVSLQKEYWDKVVSYTVKELQEGRTPSPDIFCNRRIKFGAFLDRAGESLDKVASGHYAVVREGADGCFHVYRSPDPVKDQTYFLSHLTQQQAALALFPVGAMQKTEVRAAAARLNLPNRNRRDSQGICFLGKIKYSDFVRHYLGEKEGPVVEEATGKILGHHKGSWFYTIGQRSGLGLSGGPWYVVKRSREENTVFVANTPAAVKAARNSFTAVNASWICRAPELPERLTLKLRHGPRLVEARVEAREEAREAAREEAREEARSSENNGKNRLSVIMDEPDRGVASGQFAVFYKGEECLGGAMVE